MNEYQLIEFREERTAIKINSDKLKLSEVLSDFYENKMSILFDEDGCSRGFIIVFLNSKRIISIRDIMLRDGDEIKIVASISGG